MTKYIIELQVSDGGVIDTRIADNEEDIKGAMLDVIHGVNDFYAGDKVTVREVRS